MNSFLLVTVTLRGTFYYTGAVGAAWFSPERACAFTYGSLYSAKVAAARHNVYSAPRGLTWLAVAVPVP